MSGMTPKVSNESGLFGLEAYVFGVSCHFDLIHTVSIVQEIGILLLNLSTILLRIISVAHASKMNISKAGLSG